MNSKKIVLHLWGNDRRDSPEPLNTNRMTNFTEEFHTINSKKIGLYFLLT
jgi:hypothetical protein